MYNYDFENEKVLEEFVNMAVDVNKKRMVLDIIITNRNILMFRETTQDNVLSSVYVHHIPKYELLYLFDKDVEIKNEPTPDDTTIQAKDETIVIYNLDLK
jgi:hypothetical protein